MPNQLSSSKRRITLAEHRGVVAALNELADQREMSASDLVRMAIRKLVAEETADPAMAKRLRRVVMEASPVMPPHFRTPGQVSRFKRRQREYDDVLQALNLVGPEEVQARNSIVRNRTKLRLVSMK